VAGWKWTAGTAGLLVLAALAASVAPEPGPAAPRPAGARRAVVWVHDEWASGARSASALGRSCPEGSLLESEVAAVGAALAGLGYTTEVRGAAASPEELVGFDLVLAHDGGWGSALAASERSTLLRLRSAGVPVVLIGDDAGMRLRNDAELRAWFGMDLVVHNGRMPQDLTIGGSVVRYEKEVDLVRVRPGLQVGAWTDTGDPLAWVADAHAAVLLASLRASDVCPVTSPEGEAALGDLLRGLVTSIAR
jgi:hypothetical protein